MTRNIRGDRGKHSHGSSRRDTRDVDNNGAGSSRRRETQQQDHATADVLVHLLGKYHAKHANLIKLLRKNEHGGCICSVIKAAKAFEDESVQREDNMGLDDNGRSTTSAATTINANQQGFFFPGTRISSRDVMPPMVWLNLDKSKERHQREPARVLLSRHPHLKLRRHAIDGVAQLDESKERHQQ